MAHILRQLGSAGVHGRNKPGGEVSYLPMCVTGVMALGVKSHVGVFQPILGPVCNRYPPVPAILRCQQQPLLLVPSTPTGVVVVGVEGHVGVCQPVDGHPLRQLAAHVAARAAVLVPRAQHRLQGRHRQPSHFRNCGTK